MICRTVAALLTDRQHEFLCTAGAWPETAGGMLALTSIAVAILFPITLALLGMPSRPGRLAAVGGAVIAALALGLAAGAPEWRRVVEPAGRHLVVVVDRSESAGRDFAAWRAAMTELAGVLQRIAEADPAALGSVIGLAGDAEPLTPRPVPLGRAADLLGRLDPPDGEASLPAPALAEALRAITRSSLPGEIVVASDGLWTAHSPETETAEAAARGVPIHVWPLTAARPRHGIVSTHLPRDVEAGADVPVRAVITGSAEAETVMVTIAVNGVERSRSMHRLDHGLHPLRFDQRFEDRGVQLIEIALTDAGGHRQDRRLYTRVRAPARLAVAGPAVWTDLLPRDRFQVHRFADPAQAFEPTEADVVVLDALPPAGLHRETATRLAGAIQRNGTGLLVINGPLQGDPGRPTVLRGYAGGPLDPLLPVAAEPSLQRRDPPPRVVAIVIDVSGSMSGGPLQAAQRIALTLVEPLRERDFLVIDTFPRVPGAMLTPQRVTPATRQAALALINGLTATGGSDVGAGVNLLEALRGNECAAFLITDGMVEGSRMFVPGCSFNYLEVGSGTFTNQELMRTGTTYGQAELVSPVGPVRPIRFKFFDPEPEPHFYRPGPVPVASRRADPLVAPILPVPGVAISYARPEAEIVSFRDGWPADPVLAFRREANSVRAGETGVFTSDINGWMQNPTAREALMRHLERLAGTGAKDQPDIAVDESAGRLAVRIAAPSWRAAIDLDDGRTLEGRQVEARSGESTTSFDLPAGDGAPLRGRLRVTAHEGRGWSMPIVVGSGRRNPGATIEAMTAGRDIAALRALAAATGGRIGPFTTLSAAPSPPRPQRTPLHAPLLALAAIAALGALFTQRRIQ